MKLPLAAVAVAALLLVTLVAPRAALADAAGALKEAEARLYAGEAARAAELTEPLTRDPSLPKADRAQAWRLYGLALFQLGRHVEADAALFEYLKLEPEAHLDPTLFAPEVVAFFEGVRAAHAGELRRLKPRPARKGHVLMNLLPPAGQFQNGQAAKGWAIGTAEVLLLATHVTTYYLFDDMCDDSTGVCDDPGQAETLRTVNQVSGALLIGVVVYGAVDGWLGWKRRGEQPGYDMSLAPTEGGAAFVLTGSW